MGFLDRFSGPLLSLLRVMSGLLFLEHGTAKFFHFPPTEMFATAPQSMTLPWFAGILELVGGALLTAGLGTRVVAFILSGEMAFAYFIAHAPQAFYPLQNQGEAALLFCFIFLYLAAVGGGPIALDRGLAKKA